MASYAGGDDGQLGVVYGLSVDRLRLLMCRLAREPALADDLAHDVYLRVHAARSSYRLGAPVMPWLHAIGKRLFLDDLRRKRRMMPGAEGDVARMERVAPGLSPYDIVSNAQLAALVERHLTQLPKAQATAFRMIKQSQLSTSEAAALAETTEATVKVRAHRACQLLRARVESAADPRVVPRRTGT